MRGRGSDEGVGNDINVSTMPGRSSWRWSVASPLFSTAKGGPPELPGPCPTVGTLGGSLDNVINIHIQNISGLWHLSGHLSVDPLFLN